MLEKVIYRGKSYGEKKCLEKISLSIFFQKKFFHGFFGNNFEKRFPEIFLEKIVIGKNLS